MTITLTTERLKQFALDKRMCNVTDEITSMALELIGSRETIDAQAAQHETAKRAIENLDAERNSLRKELAARVKELEEEARYYKERYWLSQNELAALRQQKIQHAPVAVPDKLEGEMVRHGGNGAFHMGKEAGWNACRAEVLRLNSGSKPE